MRESSQRGTNLQLHLGPRKNEGIAEDCGGCEFEYGKQLGGVFAAWIIVQKVSDLILNINVYMADIATKKLTFVHSVDIRGNTDETWTRGMNYLLENYLLAASP